MGTLFLDFGSRNWCSGVTPGIFRPQPCERAVCQEKSGESWRDDHEDTGKYLAPYMSNSIRSLSSNPHTFPLLYSVLWPAFCALFCAAGSQRLGARAELGRSSHRLVRCVGVAWKKKEFLCTSIFRSRRPLPFSLPLAVAHHEDLCLVMLTVYLRPTA